MNVATAAVFVWLGMVLAISFIEAPLKFRAPGVTLKIGLGIGRSVFRALNVFEYAFAIGIAFALFTHETSAYPTVARGGAIPALPTQPRAVRPRLSRRTPAVLDGDEGRRSNAHY